MIQRGGYRKTDRLHPVGTIFALYTGEGLFCLYNTYKGKNDYVLRNRLTRRPVRFVRYGEYSPESKTFVAVTQRERNGETFEDHYLIADNDTRLLGPYEYLGKEIRGYRAVRQHSRWGFIESTTGTPAWKKVSWYKLADGQKLDEWFDGGLATILNQDGSKTAVFYQMNYRRLYYHPIKLEEVTQVGKGTYALKLCRKEAYQLVLYDGKSIRSIGFYSTQPEYDAHIDGYIARITDHYCLVLNNRTYEHIAWQNSKFKVSATVLFNYDETGRRWRAYSRKYGFEFGMDWTISNIREEYGRLELVIYKGGASLIVGIKKMEELLQECFRMGPVPEIPCLDTRDIQGGPIKEPIVKTAGNPPVEVPIDDNGVEPETKDFPVSDDPAPPYENIPEGTFPLKIHAIGMLANPSKHINKDGYLHLTRNCRSIDKGSLIGWIDCKNGEIAITRIKNAGTFRVEAFMTFDCSLYPRLSQASSYKIQLIEPTQVADKEELLDWLENYFGKKTEDVDCGKGRTKSEARCDTVSDMDLTPMKKTPSTVSFTIDSNKYKLLPGDKFPNPEFFQRRKYVIKETVILILLQEDNMVSFCRSGKNNMYEILGCGNRENQVISEYGANENRQIMENKKRILLFRQRTDLTIVFEDEVRTLGYTTAEQAFGKRTRQVLIFKLQSLDSGSGMDLSDIQAYRNERGQIGVARIEQAEEILRQMKEDNRQLEKNLSACEEQKKTLQGIMERIKDMLPK